MSENFDRLKMNVEMSVISNKRDGSCDEDATNPKRKRKETPRHRWSVKETMTVLEYMKDSVILGHGLEKPTAVKYYRRMLKQCTLDAAVTESKLINFIRNIKEKYKSAVAWQNETGQGVRETEGEESLQEVLEKRCPNFNLCSEIWGAKINIHIPYKRASTKIGEDVEDSQLVESQTLHEDNQSEDMGSQALDVESQSMDVNKELTVLSVEDFTDNPFVFDDDPPTSLNASPKKKHTVVTRPRAFTCKRTSSHSSVGSGYIEAAMVQRSEATLERCKLEREKITNETKMFEKKLEFEVKQHEDHKALEAQRINNVVEIRRLEMQEKLEMKKLEIQHDEIKLQLARLQSK